MRAILTAALASGAMFAAGCGAAAGEGPGRPPVMFADNCAPCHGEAGHGKVEIAAPGIAGLPEWYVAAQLEKFRKGVRGAHHADLEGLRMRPMSRTLRPDEIQPMAAYVASMAPAADEAHPAGDPAAGKAHYTACAACHGQDGKGNQALNAPPIGLLQSWYVESQLRKFRSGVRGAHPDDVTGAQMAPMAKTIPNEQAVHDLSAYVSTL